MSNHVPTYVSLCLGVVGIAALPGIKVRDCWECVVGDVPVEYVGDHFAGDVVVEFPDLFLDVAQKGVTGLAGLITHPDSSAP